MRKLSHIIVCTAVLIPSSLFMQSAVADEAEALVGNAESGKALFDTICAHCHKTTYDESRIGAPGLQGVLERHEVAWLNEWIKSPEAFSKKDEYAKDLISSNQFGLAMPTLPAMQDDQKRADIIEFLKTLK